MNKMTIFLQRILVLTILFFPMACSHLFFYPSKIFYADPYEDYKIEYEERNLHTSDGETLKFWFLKSQKEDKSLVLFFHGNAENISSQFLNLAFLLEHGHDLIIFDYRGYGVSTGVPTIKGVQNDGIDALNFSYEYFLKKNSKKRNRYKNFIVLGQSLGGMILMMALEKFKEKDQISLTVFDSTFSSFNDLASSHLGPLSFLSNLLIYDAISMKEFLKTYKGKTLVIHDKKDDIVPFQFGEEIFSLLPKGNKEFIGTKDAGHINALNREDVREKFLKVLHGL